MCTCTCQLYRTVNVCAHLALITKYEDEFKKLSLARGDVQGTVPVSNRQGVVVAYAVQDAIVRVKGNGEFSCTRCSGQYCYHAADAKKYAKDHMGIFAYTNEDVLKGNDDDQDSKDPYLTAKKGA